MKLVPKSWGDLGIRSDNLFSSIVPYSLLAALLIVGLFLILRISRAFSVAMFIEWHKLYPSLAILVVLSTLQELLFRGYFIFVLKSVSKSVFVVVFIDAVLFAILHLFFPYAIILAPAAFVSGAAFATVYYYYPNLILASFVHSLLLAAQISFCYLSLVSC